MAEQYLTKYPGKRIDEIIETLNPDKTFIITDENVEKLVFSKLGDSTVVKQAPRIVLHPGEKYKSIETVMEIWGKLQDFAATRRSIVLNIGGGVITDMGGFAAATFKRGLRTVNLPTTLLGAVDAATGGKTGINFNGLKNEIGSFHQPEKVIITAEPFRSLSHSEIMSGYAEMVKTGFIGDKHLYDELLNVDKILGDFSLLEQAVVKCVAFKEDVVASDPYEKGLRKILNFGHTAGHAFESLLIERGKPVTHGEAVAHGMLVALIVSHLKLGFGRHEMEGYREWLRKEYGGPLISKEDISEVIARMKSDKKNKRYGEPAFTLLEKIGVPVIDCIVKDDEINEALQDYLR